MRKKVTVPKGAHWRLILNVRRRLPVRVFKRIRARATVNRRPYLNGEGAFT